MNKNILLTTLLIASFSLSAVAQIIGGEAFLQGTYLEVGVSDCGSFGTAGTPPAGYHENPPGGGLGFVADPDADGWTVGTPPYFGDYFLPGAPLEGWGIEFNGNTYYNANDGGVCGSDDIPGSVSGYSTAGGNTSVDWNGAIAGVTVSSNTWFPTGALYFITDVTLCNTTAADIYDLYFLRTVDPDNEQVQGGGFETYQEIISQPGITGCAAFVSATGLIDSAFLGLGALSPNAVVSYNNSTLELPSTIANAYNGVAPNTTTGSLSVDGSIALTFKFDTLAAGDCVTLSYAYVLNENQLGEALAQTSNASVTANGDDISTSLTYQYCPSNPVPVTLVISGGSGWVWSPATGLNTTTGDSVIATVPGDMVYTVTGVDDVCGPVVRTITINSDSSLIANAGADLVICNGDSVQLQALGEPPFQWLPSTGLSDPNIANPMCYATTDQIYVLNTTCGFDVLNVNIIPDFSTSIAQPDTICINGSTPITLTSSPSSVAIDSILWEDAGTLDTYFGATVVASPIATTTYYTTATSVDGCIVEDTVSVYVSGLAPNVVVNPSDTTVCAGVDVVLEAELILATTDYSVSTVPFSTVPGSGTSVSLFDDQVSGALPIGFSFDFYGNTYTDFYISSNGFITFTAGTNSGCCSGQNLPSTFDPNNLIAFAWEDLNPSAGGTIEYFVTGTAPNQALVMNFINVPHYGGGDLVTAQVVLYQSSNQVVINLTSMPGLTGNHTMGIENADGTEGYSPVGYNAQSWSASNESWAYTPLGAVGDITYTWSPPTYLNVDTGLSVISSPGADITYTVTADNGTCSSTAMVTVNIDTSLTLVSSSADVITCNITPQELYVEATSSSALSYSWSPSTGLNCTTCDTVIASPATSTCYVVTIESATGSSCTIYDTICISIDSDFNISNSTTVDASCIGVANGSLEIFTLDGTSPINYSIDNGTTSQLTSSFSGLDAGMYNVVVTDNEGCLDTAIITIGISGDFSIDNTTVVDASCIGANNGSLEIFTSDGASPVNYSIDNGASSQLISSFDDLSAGLYNVVVTDNDGCIDTTLVSVGITGDFSIDNTTVVDASCFGIPNGSVEIFTSDGANPINYSIDNGATSQLANTFSDLATGTYSVVVTDNDNCEDNTSITIVEPSQIQVSYTTIDSACFNMADGSIEVTVSGGTSATGDYTYSLNGATNITNSSPFTVNGLLGDTSYVLELLDDNNCLSTNSVLIEEFSEVIVTVSEDTCLFSNETVTLNSSGSYVTYSWTPSTDLSCSDCPSPIATVTQSTEYSLSVIDANGCASVNDASVNVCLLLSEIVIPDAFTPNGDNLNDRFFSKELVPPGYTLNSIKIYNRWGDLIYNGTDAGWDGTFNGKDQLSELYLYYVEFETADGEIVKYNGNVSLIR